MSAPVFSPTSAVTMPPSTPRPPPPVTSVLSSSTISRQQQRRQRPVTLIVATTPVPMSSGRTTIDNNDASKMSSTRLGIGLNNTLPWPRIKADMSFFARVTSRSPRPGSTNAIIMGRKTYESIPKTLRPLGKRLNVVISRDISGAVKRGVVEELAFQRQKAAAAKLKKQQQQVGKELEGGGGTEAARDRKGIVEQQQQQAQEPVTDVLVMSSLEDALAELSAVSATSSQSPLPGSQQQQESPSEIGNIFVIGGGEIYASALRLPVDGPFGRGLRIIMTKVKKRQTTSDGDISSSSSQTGFECDTFFPIDDFSPQSGWREVPSEELEEWVGEPVNPGWQDEDDVSIKVVGYERAV